MYLCPYFPPGDSSAIFFFFFFNFFFFFFQAEDGIRSAQESRGLGDVYKGQVYKQAMPLADMLCLTEIDAEAPQVDAYFPAVESAIWHEKSRESHLVDEKHPCPYAFVDYIRK